MLSDPRRLRMDRSWTAVRQDFGPLSVPMPGAGTGTARPLPLLGARLRCDSDWCPSESLVTAARAGPGTGIAFPLPPPACVDARRCLGVPQHVLTRDP